MSSQNLHRPGLTTPYGLRRAKVGFGTPSGPYFKYVILISRKDFRYGNKEKIVIQDLNYNLCFVEPSIRFVSIITITPFYHISICIISTNMSVII